MKVLAGKKFRSDEEKRAICTEYFNRKPRTGQAILTKHNLDCGQVLSWGKQFGFADKIVKQRKKSVKVRSVARPVRMKNGTNPEFAVLQKEIDKLGANFISNVKDLCSRALNTGTKKAATILLQRIQKQL